MNEFFRLTGIVVWLAIVFAAFVSLAERLFT